MSKKREIVSGDELKNLILDTIGIVEESRDCRGAVSRLNLVLAQHTLWGYPVAAGDDDACEDILRYVYDLSCVEKRPGKVYFAVSYVVNTMIRAYKMPRNHRTPLYKTAYSVLLATHPMKQKV